MKHFLKSALLGLLLWSGIFSIANADTFNVVENGASVNPNTATSYYFGSQFSTALSTNASQHTSSVPIAGFLSSVSFDARVGVIGTNELAIVSIQNVTSGNFYTLCNIGFTTTSVVSCDVTGSALYGFTVNPGDQVAVEISTPNWVTKPTGLTATANLVFTTGTSTQLVTQIDNANEDYFFGILTFFFLTFGVIIVFKRK